MVTTMTNAPGDTDNSGSGHNASQLVTTWRTVQKLDADAWRKLRDDAPFRFIRWLGALGVVIGTWYLQGTPHDATAWLPTLAIVALLLLPDASSIAFGGFSWQVRQAADQAAQAAQASQAASETANRVALTFNVGAAAGEVAVESAQARAAPQEPADTALEWYL
jgi:hypothetical protein